MADVTQIRHFDTVDSTNTYCSKLAREGQVAPIWVLADQQTNGRGRLNRQWRSGSGNLYASGLYFLNYPPAQLAELGFAAALAILDALAAFTPIEDLSLKWPNDILFDDAKLAGILPESGQQNGHNWLVMGVGINLAEAPVIEDRKTACLVNAPAPIDFLPTLISAYERWIGIWQAEGFTPLRQAWLSHAYGLGKQIQTSDGQIGVFEDLGKNGALLLRKSSGQVIEISAGEVFFPKDQELY